MENTEQICTPEPHRVPLSFNLGNWPTVTVIFQFSSVAQSCPTLSDPMDCSLPDSSAHGIFKARVLETFPEFQRVDSNNC